MKIINFKLLTYGFFLVFILCGCKKDDDFFPVAGYLKSMIPYKNGQLVKFTSADNQEIIAKVEVEESLENCTACQPPKKWQVLRYVLRNTANVDYTNVATLEIVDRAENYVFMTMYSPVDNFISGRGFDFKTVNKTGQFSIDNQRYIFHKTITVATKNYNDVLEINNHPDQSPEYQVSVLYYSKEKGIIKFQYKNGKSYWLSE